MALRGIKVVELAGLAPGPFCGMILSDFGAAVTRIDKPNSFINVDKLCRGKKSIVLDLKKQAGAQVFKKLCAKADVLIEPFRPGIMEKLGLGPKDILTLNPALVYARLSGFGQEGTFANVAGHDINYISIAGVLSALGYAGEKPYPPINLVADFAGGGLMCALGICIALLERTKSGRGQVIDANMVDGAAYVSSWLWTSKNQNDIQIWGNSRGKNLLDGGAPFYQVYKTKDDKYVAVGAIEPKFYSELLNSLNLSEEDFPQWTDWEKTKEAFTKIFLSKTQEQWNAIFDNKDACVTPVLTLDEAPHHLHNSSRQSFMLDDNKNYSPRPAPLLSRTPGTSNLQEPLIGQHTEEVLREAGISESEMKSLLENDIIECNNPKAKL